MVDKTEWKLLSTVTGKQQVSIPQNVKELLIDIGCDNGYGKDIGYSFLINTNALKNTTKQYMQGYSYGTTNPNTFYCALDISKSTYILNDIVFESIGSKASVCVQKIYYRN